MTLEKTLLNSAQIFHIIGATFGINKVQQNLKNPYYWHVTHWYFRVFIGLLGFTMSFFLNQIFKVNNYDLVTSYTIIAALSVLSAFICYGIIPIIFDKINLLNSDNYIILDKIKKKYAEERNKLKENN